MRNDDKDDRWFSHIHLLIPSAVHNINHSVSGVWILSLADISKSFENSTKMTNVALLLESHHTMHEMPPTTP